MNGMNMVSLGERRKAGRQDETAQQRREIDVYWTQRQGETPGDCG